MPHPSVLHVSQPTDGGVGRYVGSLAADQRSRNWRVMVASPAGTGLPHACREAGITWLEWPARRSPGPAVLAECRSLAAVVRATRPDVVHLHSSKAGLVGRLLLRGRTPTLFQPHGWSWLAVEGPMAIASQEWERRASRWATRIICVGDGERELGVRARLRGSLVTIRNGVDTVSFRTAAAHKDAARERLSVDQRCGLAVCVGRVSRQKGQDRLLAAWPEVRRRAPGAQLLLVGEGPGTPDAHDATSGVRFAGPLADVRDVLAAADVVVVSSRWEGLSLAMLEAMAAGRSVVTTAVAGHEIVADGTGAVLSADPRDDRAVIAELTEVLVHRLDGSSTAIQEGEAAAVFAAAHLDVRETFRAMADLTSSVIGEWRAAAAL